MKKFFQQISVFFSKQLNFTFRIVKSNFRLRDMFLFLFLSSILLSYFLCWRLWSSWSWVYVSLNCFWFWRQIVGGISWRNKSCFKMIHVEIKILADSIFSLKDNILVFSTISRKWEILYFIERFSLKLSHNVALRFWFQFFKRFWTFKLLVNLRLKRNSTWLKFLLTFLLAAFASYFRCFVLNVKFLRSKDTFLG